MPPPEAPTSKPRPSSSGSMLGSAGVIVMDDQTCMVNALLNVMRFYHHESCGQCTPCREGTGWLEKIVHRIAYGHGKREDMERIDQICGRMVGKTICVLADAAATDETFVALLALLRRLHHDQASRSVTRSPAV